MNFNEEKIFRVFVDFDGTITKTDVGEAMFVKFGDEKKANEIIQLWINKKLSSVQTWHMLCDTVKNLDLREFDEFIDSIEIDQSFKRFVDYCNAGDIYISILSDGLDYYINRILKREGLETVSAYTNELTFDLNNNLIPVFKYTDEECLNCANCKRNHIINNSSDNDYTIYIGDGWSDTCPAQFCDFIFAKNSLLKFCDTNRISYFPFKNFDEIILRIEEMKKKRRLKKRHQAELKRREVYLQG
ncbi:MAG: MtnX-like HAD-IB family phosphatase [Bacteroidetes bacterium]|nr:MtnX-like HAD-IB family phosphatase [Bacteroidota bacterium]